MTQRRFLISATAAAMMSLAAISPVNGASSAMPSGDGPAKASLAAMLAQYGIDNKDPYSLLTAAPISDGLKANVAKQAPVKLTKGAKPETYDPLALLKLAKGYAAGTDASLTAAIDVETKNVSATQAVCYYQYYCNGWGYCWYQYYCY